MLDETSGQSEPAGETPAGPDQPIDLRRLVSDYYQDVYRYAYRLCGREADALDLTQQAFLLAQRKLHQLRERDKADRWLFAILRTCFLKSVARTRPTLIDTLELTLEDAAEKRRETEAADREELQQALNTLSEEYRVVVLMFYFDELSYKEIAEQLEIPIGTVMSRLARAKSRLREHLDNPPPPKDIGPVRPPVQIT